MDDNTGLTVGEAPEMETGLQALQQISEPGMFDQMAPPLQIALFLGAMVMLSGAIVSITAFTRIVIVLSFVRRALSTQEIPPTQVIIGLSLFLTLFVMAPTFSDMNNRAIQPYMAGDLTTQETLDRCTASIKTFMAVQLNKYEMGGSAVDLFMEISATQEEPADLQSVPFHVLVPAFIINELRLAFIMGFLIYIPFLLIDLVVSTVLMSLGMMMMPPVIISTPCKLLLFVIIDGWALVVGSLAQTFDVVVSTAN